MEGNLALGKEPSGAIILLNYCNYQDTISCLKTILE